MNFYSQFGEDRWMYQNLLLPPHGVFIEVGAHDGISSSNTKFFEDRGWIGVCIEPIPTLAELCRQNRKASVINAAVCDRPGPAMVGDFFVRDDDLGQSSLTGPGRKITVPTMRLADVLEKFRLPNVDLLSIDTEGTELDVFTSLGPVRPEFVIMEFLTWGKPPRDKETRNSMELLGYSEAYRTEANQIFVHHESRNSLSPPIR